MKQLNTERLRSQLHRAVDDVEQVLQRMAETTGEQVGELESRAGQKLHEARERIGEIERHAAVRVRRAGRQTGAYVREHPWQVLGGVAVAAVAVAAVVARTRH